MSTLPEARNSADNPCSGRRRMAVAALVIAWMAIGAVGLGSDVRAAAARTSSIASPDGRYPGWFDRSVAPRDDFFAFANGGWIKANPIPPDRAYWGVDSILEQENRAYIRELIESLAQDPRVSAASNERKIADFYASGMNEAVIDSAGVTPLAAELEMIRGIATAADLLRVIAHLQTIGVAVPWATGPMQDFKDSTRVIASVSQGGLGLPSRDYYLNDDKSFSVARAAYGLHIARLFVLLGESPAFAQSASKTVLSLETRLARDSMADVEQRDPHAIYHPLSSREAQELTPHLPWPEFFTALGHPEIQSFNVGMPQFFKSVDRELQRLPLEDWKLYLRFQLVDGYAPYLSAPYVDEAFRMTQVLTGAEQLQPRWIRVLRAEDEALGFAIGELYVEKRFSPAAKQAAMDMVLRIREALRHDLSTLPWMSSATRSAALAKLDLMELRVGYPNGRRDYSGLEVGRGSYALNVLRAKAAETARQLGKLGHPVDRSEWYLTPQTVNAYYDPSMNSLTVPAGILAAPYFDPTWSEAVNFGSTGATTVGHEMIHAFDDEGAQFDGHGNLKNWWTAADLAKFQRATRCVAEQFSRYRVNGGVRLQGDLVVGEAAADLGGLMLAWRALHQDGKNSVMPAEKVEGQDFSADQEFFIAFAHSWAGSIRPERAEELVTTDPHPPAEFRTNGTLSNSPQFQEAFGLAAPAPMIKPDRCVIW